MLSGTRRLATAVATVTALATAGVGLTASPAFASACGTDTGCLTPRPGHTGIAVRTGPGTGYTALGQLYSGQTIDCYGFAPCVESSLVTGQLVTACGETSNYWWVVRYNGRKAYTTYACVGQGG